MTLSNTATPIYYGRFRERVLSGEIPVCQEIELEMNRIDRLIANPLYFYDDKAIEGFIKYCEGELTLTDGSDLVLMDSFKLWSEQIFGWYWFEDVEVFHPATPLQQSYYSIESIKHRLVTKQYLIVARGGAKSMYAACLQSYFLNVDVTTTHQIAVAPTMKQAEEVLSPIRTSITRSRGPYFQFLTEGSLQNTTGNRFDRAKLASTKKGIENFLTGSRLEIRPMSIDKLQGLVTKMNTVDEWLSSEIREDVIGAIEQGAAKVPDYLIVAISSEGTVRNGSGDSIKLELADILKGTYEAPHVSIFHYKLDSVDEIPFPEKWVKAQPNLGVTVSYQIYAQDVERSEKVPVARNDIYAKRFGIPVEGQTYFFSYEETLAAEYKYDTRGLLCSMGADLSQGNDFCAFTFMFPMADGSYVLKTRSYITQRTLDLLPTALRFKYGEFMEEGTLVIMPGTVLSTLEVYDDLDEYIVEQNYQVHTMGYDPYNSKEFVDRWIAENGPYGVEKVIQGARTESVPLGEMKKLSGAALIHKDEQLMAYTMGNAVVETDNNGNMKLVKRRYEEKIDNVSAWLDAWVAYKRNREFFE